MATTAGRVRVERGEKRVRAMFGGQVVVDSTRPLLVWEKPYYPTYYFRGADVRTELLRDAGESVPSPSRGDAAVMDVVVDGAVASRAVGYRESSPISELADTYRFEWASMDHWFEEDEEVFVHARDPSTRIDALRSSRHVEVFVDGVRVADSRSPVVLFETGLPARWYLPKTHVRMDLLVPTESRTACPYKGTARYWSVVTPSGTHGDLAWGYDAPLAESAPIAGLVCFFNEKVDIHVDGEPLERPVTVFS